MRALEEIYKGIPEASLEQPIRKPSQGVLDAYFASVDAAYEQVGLAPDLSLDECPGLPTHSEEGAFQVKINVLRMRVNRATHVLASDSGEEHAFEAVINGYQTGYTEMSFSARKPGMKGMQEFGLTRASWQVLTGFIMERAEAGLFVPVQKAWISP